MASESTSSTPLDKESISTTPTPDSESQIAAPSSLHLDDESPAYNSSAAQKWIVVFTTSFVALAASFSSTSLFSAADRIAQDYGTTPEVINASSAGVLFAMGLSNFIWCPISTLSGRLIAYNACIVCLLLFTMAAALAPNLQSFMVFRILSGLQGTYFHVSGQALLAEYFPPTSRGTATGFFLCGTVLGPPLGPLIAGIVVTYQSWRIILWIQVGMVGLGLILSLVFLRKGGSAPKRPGARSKTSQLLFILRTFSPMTVLSMFAYPNVLLTDLACGFLTFTQYALLSSPRQILVSQYHLTSPIITGLFYLSPATGFLLGTLIGGCFSDHTVRQWIKRRDGLRLPQDRLRSGFVSFFLVIPAASLTYGWGIAEHAGGLALPLVAAFFIAAGLLAAFAGLNTYCAEVMPSRRTETIASKYLVQYAVSAAASGVSVPMINAIGVGMLCTIGVILVLLAGVFCIITALYGINMQVWVERRLSKR